MENVYESSYDCCGCGYCASHCPASAITMKIKDGFMYPSINSDICVDCGLCRKICTFKKVHNKDDNTTSAFAVRNNEEDICMQSSSGGVFTALAKCVLTDNGAVFGAGFDENMNLIHLIAENEKALAPLRGSKYIQSDISHCYAPISEMLKQGKKVLWVGTPCQTEPMQAEFSKYDNFFAVDLICHGVPSTEIWNSFCAFLEKKHGKKLKNYRFRNKEVSWKKYSAKAEFTDGTVSQNRNVDGCFIDIFRYDLCMRDSCTVCPYASYHRYGDLTISDFWGIESVFPEWDDNKGVSAVMIHSDKGQNMFDGIKESIQYKPCDFSDITNRQPNTKRPSVRANKHEQFMRDYAEMPFEKLLKKYTHYGLKRRIVDTVKTIINR